MIVPVTDEMSVNQRSHKTLISQRQSHLIDWVVFGCILLVIALLRLSFLPDRWVNPDEGAHLMDAVLALDGQLPIVDFHARQPLYVYLLAGWLKLGTQSLAWARGLPLLLSLINIGVLGAIAWRCGGQTLALLSMGLFALIPFESLNAPLIKTQPSVILFSGLCVFCLLHAAKSSAPKRWLLVAGMLAAAAYNVRRSAIILPILGLIIITLYAPSFRIWLRNSASYLVGYLSIFAIIALLYLQRIELQELWKIPFHPFVMLRWLFNNWGPSTSAVLDALPAVSAEPPSTATRYLLLSIQLHLFLWVAAAISVVSAALLAWRNKGIDAIRTQLVALIWLALLCAAYGTYFQASGFHLDYHRELTLPLVLLSAAWLATLPVLQRPGAKAYFFLGLGACYLFLFLWQPHHPEQFGWGYHGAIGCALLGLCLSTLGKITNTQRSKRALSALALLVLIGLGQLIPWPHQILRIAFYLMIVGTFIGFFYSAAKITWQQYFRSLSKGAAAFLLCFFLVPTVAENARRLDLRFDSIWSPKAVSLVADYLKRNTSPNDRILSGGIIWEFEADRRPFEDLAHPTTYKREMPRYMRNAINEAFSIDPPAIVILDTYTESTYLDAIPEVATQINHNYEQVFSAGPARKTVRVLRRRE